MHPEITGARVVGAYRVEITFADESTGTVDLAALIGEFNGMFEPLKDPAYFARVTVDRDAGTLVWPNGADVDPDVLYEAAHQRVTK